MSRPRVADPDRPANCSDQLRDLAAGHALGCLDEDDKRRFEAHLEHCQDCSDERLRHDATVARLGALAPRLGPDPDLKARVLQRIRASDPPARSEQVWRRWRPVEAGADGLAIVGADDPSWQPTGVQGVVARRLAVDPDRDQVTMLVRMDPQTSYPAHRHAGTEQCYVLRGDLQMAGRSLGPGDFMQAIAGSTHGVQSTIGGCELLIVSSLNDELVDQSPES